MYDHEKPTFKNFARAILGGILIAVLAVGPLGWLLLEYKEPIREFVGAYLGAERPN